MSQLHLHTQPAQCQQRATQSLVCGQSSECSWVSVLQSGMKNALDLEFQLDAVDYDKPNFVHADMTPKEFAVAQEKAGESILGLMWKAMVQEMKRARDGENEDPGMAGLAGRVDVALLPVGRWGAPQGPPRLSPATAVEAATLVGARVAIPIHWGTLYIPGFSAGRWGWGSLDAGDAFATEAARRTPDLDVRVLRPGESTDLDTGEAAPPD